MALIDRLGLYSTIFSDPKDERSPIPDITHWSVAYECLDELKSNKTPGSIYTSLVRSEDASYLAWILAALTPLSQFPLSQPANGNYKELLPIGYKVAREGLKLEKKICNMVTGAFNHREEIMELKNTIGRNDTYSNQRGTVGMTIRRWNSQGGHWRLQALFAILVDAFSRASTCETPFI